VSEYCASIIVTEQDEIKTDGESNQPFIDDKIKELNFINELKECIEMASWSGTCAAVIRLKNAVIVNGVMTIDTDTEYDLVKVAADKIVPLRIEHGKIIDCAFTSETTIEDRKIIYIEIHELENDGYKITNRFIDSKTGKEVMIPNVLRSFKTNSTTPLFAILEPPKLNSIENNLGLGLSVYANAIPQLKACDITYNNFVMDYYLGGKKIIYNNKLIKYKTITQINDDGTTTTKDVPIYPDDITKQQFMQVGDELNTEKNELIHEYNPALRTEENKEGIQYALNMFGFKCGLGTKYYEFNGNAVVTATQYTGDRQDLMKNAKKYRDNLDVFVQDLVRAILLLGRLVYGANVTEDCQVAITNKDGILVSDEEVKEQYIKEIAAGLRQAYEYRMRFMGEDEETAKRMIAEETIPVLNEE
jgi:A118 family predicted phage portal protein